MPDSSEDRDTKEALKEFDFLATSEDTDSQSRSAGDGTDWGKEACWAQPRALGSSRRTMPWKHYTEMPRVSAVWVVWLPIRKTV